jgi:hypothetical protein
LNQKKGKRIMRFYISDRSKVQLLAVTAMLLAYEAAGGTTGLGFLQTRHNVDVNEIERLCPPREDGLYKNRFEINGDYVAGRMIKTRIIFEKVEGWIEVADNTPSPDYQGWSSGIPRDPGVRATFHAMNGGSQTKYNSYEALVRAAAERIGVELLTEDPALS